MQWGGVIASICLHTMGGGGLISAILVHAYKLHEPKVA